jgi:hypothetical protein
MSKEKDIKTWISEIKTGKKLNPDSILIRKTGTETYSVHLLDHACCRPALVFQKPLECIEKEDLIAFEHVINHVHS